MSMAIPWQVGGLILLISVVSACGKTETVAEAPRPVMTQIVAVEGESRASIYSGEIRSRYETLLAFRIPGKISARLVDAGARVRTGDVLARLDPADTALSQASAEAQLDLAEADLHRYRDLRSKNFVSQSALDAKETAYKAARAQAELARNQSGYAVLRADRDGVIDQVLAEAGQVVAAGQAVMRHSRSDMLEVAVSVPESRMSEIRLHQKVSVGLWADERARYRGEVRELSSMADSVTRTYAARVSILDADSHLRLGMTATVALAQDTPGKTVAPKMGVPLTAIFQQDGKPAVWIVGPDQAITLRPVTVAALTETQALLSAGLVVGERIVVAGVHKLTAGEKIRVVDQPAVR